MLMHKVVDNLAIPRLHMTNSTIFRLQQKKKKEQVEVMHFQDGSSRLKVS